jgi:Protein of unknown function (DUF1552)
MIITNKAISRRTVLRGIGTSLALPFLDSMIPAFGSAARAAAQPIRRFGVVYVPNGMVMQLWTPKADGAAFELTQTLKPLEPFRNQMLVLTGLSSNPPIGGLAGAAAGVHARASTRFLTDVPPRRGQGLEIEAGTSVDQIIAKEFGKYTQLSSLELSLEGRDFTGSCDAGYSCAYTNTIAWRGPTTPLPVENDPRAVFERLFGDGGSTAPAARLARIRGDRSLLDSVSDRIAHLRTKIGARDGAKLGEYLDAVRDIERRIQKAEEQSNQQLPLLDRPAGVPETYEAHAKLMLDLQVLAYQTDLTRVITLMMGRELSSRTYPEIGVTEAHHPISHHLGDPAKLASLAKINSFHMTQFAYYLEKLRATPDGDGSLLDHMILMYGAGMADSNLHSPNGLPLLILGGGSGALKGGRHIKYKMDTPLANLHLTFLDKLSIPTVESIGDSTGKVEQLSVA